jgi:hypothetical protein
VTDCEQDEFYTARHAELLKNPEQVGFDSVFAESQLDRNLAIAHSIRDQGDDLLLARSKQAFAIEANGTERRHVSDKFQKMSYLRGIRPNLPALHDMDAFT